MKRYLNNITGDYNIRYSANIIITLICVLLSSYTFALDNNGLFAIWGKGSKSCHSYNIARNTADDQAFKNYLMGYLTSANIQMENTYSISGKMNINDILVWLDEYCQSKPITSFAHSLADFIIEHYDKRTKQAPSSAPRR